MTIPTKLTIGVLSSGFVAGMGYVGSTYLLKSNEIVNQTKQKIAISALIDTDKYVLLSTSKESEQDNAFWKTISDSYNSQNANSEIGSDPLKLNGWKKNNKTDLTEALKSKCKEMTRQEVTNVPDLIHKDVEKYCTRGVTVKEDVEKKGKAVLDTNKDATVWAQRHKDKKTLISNLSTLDVKEAEEAITEDIIKKACSGSISKNKKDEKNYQVIYEAYEKVCTRQADDPQ